MDDVLNMSAEVIAAIFGIAVTVVAIIVQLAATRYNHHIAVMFIRDATNIAVQSLFVVVTLLCVWIAAFPDQTSALHMLTLILVSLAIATLLPYFGYVFTFISPLNIIRRMVKQTRRAIKAGRADDAIGAINQLQDVARSAIESGDRAIALSAVDALEEVFRDYRAHKAVLASDWFEFPGLAHDPDFVSYETGALNEIVRSGLWFETKVLQQFLNIMWLAAPSMREVAAALGMAAGRLSRAESEDHALQKLIQVTMNSLLRASLNARDARTAYHLFSQYRSMAEYAAEQQNLEELQRVVRHIGEYGVLGYEMGLPFVLEVAAYDISQIVLKSSAKQLTVTRTLLRELLELDREIRSEAQEKSLLGVRRAQLQAAAALSAAGEEALVSEILADLKGEAPERLERIVNSLKLAQPELYWEFTPRGVNFNYLEPALQPHLDRLLAQLPAQAREQTSGG